MSDSNCNSTKDKRCENCYFYNKEEGICEDYDGFYFHWKMRLTSHCPDFQTEEEVKKYGIRFD